MSRNTSSSTQTNHPDDAVALVAQVLQGSLPPSVAAERLAISNSPSIPQELLSPTYQKPWSSYFTSQISGHGRLSGPEQHAGPGQLLEIDCLSPANVQLAREIHQLLLGSWPVIAHPSNPQKAFIEFRKNCEPFPALVDRLGWPPPQPLVNRWLQTLKSWEIELVERGFPVDVGRVDELVIDEQAELTWPLLPFRIAQSMVLRNPAISQKPTNNDLLKLWKPASPSENQLAVLLQMTRLVAFNPNPANSPSTITTKHEPSSVSNATLTPGPKNRSTRPHARRRKTSAILLATAAAVVAFLALRLWNQSQTVAEKASPSQSGGEPRISASSPGAASLFGEQNGRTALNSARSSQPKPEVELTELTTTAEVPLETIQSPTNSNANLVDQLSLTQLDFDPIANSIAGPAVDPTTQGFAPEPQADSAAPENQLDSAQPDQRLETSGDPNSTAPALSTVNLPDRRDQEPFVISFRDTVTPQTLSLSFPGSTPWKLYSRGESTSEVWIVETKEQDESRGVAKLSWNTDTNTTTNNTSNNTSNTVNAQPADLRFQWTEFAANNPAVETLRNGRLAAPSGQMHYLRSPFTLTRQPIRLTDEVEYPLTPPPDSGCTTTSFAIQPLAQPNVEQKLPIFRWLTPSESLKGRKLRALIEFQTAEEAPVSVRSRIDLELGRQALLTTVSIATLDGGLTWFTIAEEDLLSSLDRLGNFKTSLAQRLSNIQRLYDNTNDSDRRRVIRNQREQLELQEEALQQYSVRLVELQKLVAQIASELTLELNIVTSWPDAQQVILQTATQLN